MHGRAQTHARVYVLCNAVFFMESNNIFSFFFLVNKIIFFLSLFMKKGIFYRWADTSLIKLMLCVPNLFIDGHMPFVECHVINLKQWYLLLFEWSIPIYPNFLIWKISLHNNLKSVFLIWKISLHIYRFFT